MLAIQALAFIAEEPERLNLFLVSTGIEAAEIRTAAREPGFLAGVLEHMLADESLLIEVRTGKTVDIAALKRVGPPVIIFAGGPALFSPCAPREASLS